MKKVNWHNLVEVVRHLRNALSTSELGSELINKETAREMRDIINSPSKDVATTTTKGLMSAQDKIDLSNKVDKVVGKNLSSNDFTTEEKQKLADLESIIDSKIDDIVETTPGTFETLREITEWIENNGVEAAELSSQLALKVDKESGKSLMTDEERIKLSNLNTQDFTDNQIINLSNNITYLGLNKADSGHNHNISDLIGATPLITKLGTIEQGAQVNPNMTLYVEKVSGKQLSTNDFTNTEKSKLSSIEVGAQVNPDLTPYALKTELGNISSFKVWTGQVRTTESDGYITVDFSSAGFTQPPTVVATALSPNAGTDTSANNAAWCSVIQGSVTNTGCRIRSKSADSAGLLAAMVSVNITTNINIIAIGK